MFLFFKLKVNNLFGAFQGSEDPSAKYLPFSTIDCVHLSFPGLIIMVTYDDIDFYLRHLKRLGTSLCLS